MEEIERPPLPPFSLETATEKVRLAEDRLEQPQPRNVSPSPIRDGQPVAKPHRVFERPRRYREFS